MVGSYSYLQTVSGRFPPGQISSGEFPPGSVLGFGLGGIWSGGIHQGGRIDQGEFP